MLKRLISIICSVFLAVNIFAQSLVPVDANSAIKFTIKNFGVTVNGSFRGLKGNILFDAANASAAVFNLSVDAATVNTGINSRDNHLRKEEYFNVNKFPLINFLSTKVTATGKEGIFNVSGNITIKGVTKNISFPFTVIPKQNAYEFSGTFKLNRRDFGIGSGSLILSDNLDVSFSIYATK